LQQRLLNIAITRIFQLGHGITSGLRFQPKRLCLTLEVRYFSRVLWKLTSSGILTFNQFSMSCMAAPGGSSLQRVQPDGYGLRTTLITQFFASRAISALEVCGVTAGIHSLFEKSAVAAAYGKRNNDAGADFKDIGTKSDDFAMFS
jgi:hypothetical protein